MIVPSMTLEEIRKEIIKDFPILFRKVGYVEHDLKKRLTKKQIDDGFTKFYDYNSKYKNQWIYRIRFCKKEVETTVMLHFFDGKGYGGISVTSDFVIVYQTGHFFKRYNERLKLNLIHLKDIMIAFMNENMVYEFSPYSEPLPGIFSVFGKVKSGTVFGTLNEKLRIIKVNTFLPNDMLNQKQKDLLRQLNEAEPTSFSQITASIRSILEKENKAEPADC